MLNCVRFRLYAFKKSMKCLCNFSYAILSVSSACSRNQVHFLPRHVYTRARTRAQHIAVIAASNFSGDLFCSGYLDVRNRVSSQRNFFRRTTVTRRSIPFIVSRHSSDMNHHRPKVRIVIERCFARFNCRG